MLGALRIAHNVATRYRRMARIWRHDACQHAQSRRLACAIRAYESEDFALAHVECDSVDSAHAREALRESFGLYCDGTLGFGRGGHYFAGAGWPGFEAGASCRCASAGMPGFSSWFGLSTSILMR